jgi:hypothetical protein
MASEYFGDAGTSGYRTSLSRNPFNSRFTEFEMNNDNYVAIGFTPGLALQAAELNEVQENTQKFLTLSNLMHSYWNVKLMKDINEDSTYISSIDSYLDSVFPHSAIPLKPFQVQANYNPTNLVYDYNIIEGWYYIKDLSGVGYWVYLDEPINLTLSNEGGYVILNISNEDVFSSEDERLYDNSAGYPNTNSPGSYRIKRKITGAQYVQTVADTQCVISIINKTAPQTSEILFSNNLKITTS